MVLLGMIVTTLALCAGSVVLVQKTLLQDAERETGGYY